MESKISKRLKEPLAKEICEYIYWPRLERDFKKQFSYLTEINKAHLLMLANMQLLAPEIASKLAATLLQMECDGPNAVELDAAKEDPYFNYEAKLMELAGRDVGGRLHMARSRNDIAATIDRIRARDAVLDLLDALGRVRRVALERAVEFKDVVMPGYTHLQPAQPITFGFYLSGVAASFGRDMDRLRSAVPRINAMPLGAGALAGTRFSIDRSVTAKALGFTSIVPNSLDAVASRDFAWEAMSAIVISAVTWGRVAQDFYVWCTPEFGLVSFPDRVASTSSIMPQKKNPAVLEYLKGKSGHMIGLLTTSLVTVKGTHFTHSGDGNRESMRSFWECCEETLRCLALFELVLSTVMPQQEDMLKRVSFDFSVATDLADGLVVEAGLSFRDAHHVVGALVRLALDSGRSAMDLTSELLDRAAVDVIGRAIEWPESLLSRYLSPVESVNARRNGGPAPSDLPIAVNQQLSHLEEVLTYCRVTRAHLHSAHDRLQKSTEELAGN